MTPCGLCFLIHFMKLKHDPWWVLYLITFWNLNLLGFCFSFFFDPLHPHDLDVWSYKIRSLLAFLFCFNHFRGYCYVIHHSCSFHHRKWCWNWTYTMTKPSKRPWKQFQVFQVLNFLITTPVCFTTKQRKTKAGLGFIYFLFIFWASSSNHTFLSCVKTLQESTL